MSKVVVRWSRVWVLVLLVLLSACSGTSFVYNRLDFLLPWYVDDYAELDQAQTIYLDELLAPFLNWHRTQELPAYLKVLGVIEDRLKQPLTPAGVAAIFAEFEQAWLRLESESLDWLLELGAQLSDEQIAGFLDVLREQQEEYEKKYLTRTDEEFYQDSYDNLADNAKEYFGALSDAQRDLLRQSSRRLLRSDRAWLQERAQWLTQLAQLLKRESQWQERVRDAVFARRNTLSPEYQRIFEHNMGVIYELIAKLLNERSEPQDRHLRAELTELRRDLNALIAQGKATTQLPSG